MKRSRYFSIASGLILLLSLWSFSDNFIWNVGQPSNSDPKFIIHGLFCLAWMLALFIQASLIPAGRVQLHRKLGIAGFLAAAGVALTTVWIFVVNWKGWEAMPFYIQANRLQLPTFAVLVWLGYLNRRRPDWHKRLVFAATLFVLEPILSRAFDPLNPLLLRFTDAQVDFAWWIFFVATWSGFWLSLLAHDWKTLRRIHPVTAWSFAWFVAIWIIVWLV
jgi:hypothetical protein